MERKLIAVAVSTALGFPLGANAVDLAVSGHINRAVVVIDQDMLATDGELQHVDANASESRYTFDASGDLDNGLVASAQLQYGLGGNVRQAWASLASAGGTLTIGHASDAADNMAHARLGGLSWLGGVTNWCSYYDGVPGASNTVAGCLTHDGTRQAGLKYDTPAIGPLSISVSVGNNEHWAARAKVAGSFGDSGYDLRVGYIGKTETAVAASVAHTVAAGADTHTHTVTAATTTTAGDTIGASASVKFPQGTSIATSWGQSDAAGTESQHIELDHSYGNGSIGIVYRQGENGAGENGSTWAIGVGHDLGNGANAYAGYRFIEGDDVADANVLLAGLRVSFN